LAWRGIYAHAAFLASGARAKKFAAGTRRFYYSTLLFYGMDPIPTTPSKDERLWATIAHLSGFGLYLIPGVGHIVGPLVVWLLKREGNPFVDQQGREALNFQISFSIYVIASFLLFITVIGAIIAVPLFFILPVFHIVCMVIAAIKANDGIAYRYPATIRFV
jgi:hypothetical protein